jgi:hypothetical protein
MPLEPCQFKLFHAVFIPVTLKENVFPLQLDTGVSENDGK